MGYRFDDPSTNFITTINWKILQESCFTKFNTTFCAILGNGFYTDIKREAI